MNFDQIGIRPGELLTPAPHIDPAKWAVIACDQYTSQPEYWQEVARIVGDTPSCLKLVLPECYLPESEVRIPAIHREMHRCLTGGVFTVNDNSMMLVERTTQSGKRLGLVCLTDLEAYSYSGEKSLVRPTEETITARLPARMAIRRDAPLESAHIMLLIDDPEKTVIEPLYERCAAAMSAYDFELMQGCGHLRGEVITREADLRQVCDALTALKEKQGADPLLYAVGDGNHSLASAKAHWEEIKTGLTPEQQAVHSARYAMVEIVNIHDPALQFEPIHRVLTGVADCDLMAEWAAYAAARGMTLTEGAAEGAHTFPCILGGSERVVSVLSPEDPLPVATLQRFLDDLLARHPEISIDYIHGDDVLRQLSCEAGSAGFLLPALDKASFFPAIDALGTLPRKTFSMGHAHEKRCYMECRRIDTLMP